jgi:hypothetical protein
MIEDILDSGILDNHPMVIFLLLVATVIICLVFDIDWD